MQSADRASVSGFLKKYEGIEDQIPENVRAMAVREFSAGLGHIREGWARYGVDEELFDIALAPLVGFIDDPDMKVTVLRLIYLRDLFEEYKKIANGIGIEEGAQKQLIDILVYENFNSVSFLDYYEKTVRREVAEARTMARKMIVLNNRLKDVKQYKTRPLTALYSTREDNQTRLEKWVQAEIDCLQKNAELLKLEEEELGRGKEKDLRIKVSLTASQLAFLVKLLVDFGYIKENIKENVFRFFAYYFICSKEKETTDATFKKLYQNPSLPTQLFVKKILNEMARSIS